jgi:Do/DeqQ family serine protease
MMSQKKFLFSLIFASLLGGVVTLGGYSYFFQDQNSTGQNKAGNDVVLTKYAVDTASFTVPAGLNFVYAANTVTPAVVHIRAQMAVASRQGSNPEMEKYFREFFGGNGPQNVSGGSGVIMSPDGYIVTNNHVVEKATDIEVLLNDNRTYKAKVVGTDPNTDLAVIKIDAENLPVVPFGNSEKMQIGEWVLAIGNPFEFRSTVTAGIISAKARNIGILRNANQLQIESFIQTDAAVNPGNSGGALVNLRGELIGINTAIATPTGSFAGYSFAVPTTLVEKVFKDIVEFGVVQRALLGIRIGDLTAEIAKKENIPVLSGVYISSVTDNSAAEEAGLQSGDVIVAINGKPVNGVSELQEQVAINRPGDRVDVEYIRSGKRKNVNVVLKNTMGNTDVVAIESRATVEGAVIEEVSKEMADQLGIKGGASISSLEKGKLKDAGIKASFIITSIDKRPITSIEDLTLTLAEIRPGDGILIEGIYPTGQKAYYGIGW